MRCCNARRSCDCYGCTAHGLPHCDPRPTWRELFAAWWYALDL